MSILKILYMWAAILSAISGFATGAFYLVRWVVLWMIRQDKAATSIEVIQTNHLKHIYHTLRLICTKLGIEYTEPEG